jgi:hypothetical protein
LVAVEPDVFQFIFCHGGYQSVLYFVGVPHARLTLSAAFGRAARILQFWVGY